MIMLPMLVRRHPVLFMPILAAGLAGLALGGSLLFVLSL